MCCNVPQATMKTTYAILLMALALVACGQSDRMIKCNSTTTCNIDSIHKISHLSDICDSVSLIMIDGGKDNWIGHVDKILCDDSLYYISSVNKLFVIEQSGRVRHRVNRRGHANDEYIELNDFSIAGNRLVLSDTQTKRLIVLDKSCDYVETHALDFYPEFIQLLNEQTVAISCSGNEGPRLVFYDMQQHQVIKAHFDYEKRFSLPMPNVFSSTTADNLYWQPGSNNIYELLVDGSLLCKYHIDFGKYNFDVNKLQQKDFMGQHILVDEKGSARLLNVIDNHKMLSIELDCEQKSEEAVYIVLINHDDNEKVIIDSDHFEDDMLFYNHRLVPDFSTSKGNDFVGVIYPSLWKQSIDKMNEDNSRFNHIQQYVSNMNDTQNPIICIYHMKNLSDCLRQASPREEND